MDMTSWGASRRPLVLLLTAVLITATAAACRGSDDQARASGAAPAATDTVTAAATSAAKSEPAIDPCTLVTAAEVKAALGSGYGKGTSTPGDLVSICRFAAGNNMLLVEHYPSGANTVYQNAIDGAASVSNGQVVTVSGVGDEAGYVARAQTLCAHQGTNNLCLVGGGEPALTALARKALARM
jgi:D-alanyl-D-alanine carboxypeptidase